MKINLFYVAAGTVAVVGGWAVYNTYFQSVIVPSSAKLAAAIESSPNAAASSSAAVAPKTTPSPQTSKAATASAAPSAIGPSVPTGLAAIAATDSTIDISWGASYDTAGVAGYKIFLNGSEVGTTPSQRFEAAKLQASTSYIFTVAAYDQNGVASRQSAPVMATTSVIKPGTSSSSTTSTSTTTSTTSTSTDTTVPSTPGGLTATAMSQTEIDLSWTASTDNVGVTGYEIFSSGTLIATSSGTTYKSTGLTPDSTYPYTVAAIDAAGNVSPQSASASASTPAPSSNNNTTSTADTALPTASITSPAAGITVSGTVTVSVSASDNVGVTKAELYVDGTLKGTDTASPYSFSLDTTPLSDGTHSLTAKSYDAAGNVGTASAVQITVKNSTTTTATTTPATTTPSTAPSAPTSLTAISVSSSEIDLTWAAPASGASGITGYQIFRNGHPLAQSTSLSYHDTGLSAKTTYSYTVRAYVGTAAANPGAQSTSASATTGT